MVLRVGAPARLVAAVLAALFALAPIAAGAGAGVRGAAASADPAAFAVPRGNAGFDPRTLPGLPVERATPGPLVPDPGGVLLDGSRGLSVSLTPRLLPSGASGQLDYRVTTVDGRRVWGTSSSTGPRVADGALRQGGVYLWSATDARGRTFGPYLLRVDVQRLDQQHLASYGGVSWATTTGEPSLSFQSPTAASVAGAVGAVLVFRPSNARRQARAPGLPPGWRLGGGGAYESIRRVSDGWLELTDGAGRTVAFARTPGGVWEPRAGAGSELPTGRLTTLVENPDGDLSVTERSGLVTLFPAPTVEMPVVHPSATWSAKEPTLQQLYDRTGRLSAVVDPVSGRRMTLTYAGPGADCPRPAAGASSLAPAGAGMLCRVTGWDGARTDILYAGSGADAQIGRIVTGAQAPGPLVGQTDIGWDTTGRPTRVRHAPANAGLAAGVLPGFGPANAAAPELLTTIEYDARGRVAGVTRPAALVTGQAGTPTAGRRTVSYGPEPGRTAILVPGRTRPVSVTVADPATLLVTRSVDAAGRESSATWDTARELVTERRLPGGFVERWSYDALGNVTRKVGPTRTPDDPLAPALEYDYDTAVVPCARARGSAKTESARRSACRRTVRRALPRKGRVKRQAQAPVLLTGPVVEPIAGLQATFWPNDRFDGVPVAHSTGPEIEGARPRALAVTWSRPAVGDGRWSARLHGLVLPPADGRYTFQSTSTARVWVRDAACERTCTITAGKGDPVAIRVDVVSNDAGAASARVEWSGPGASGPVPLAALRPGYGQPTRTRTLDDLGGATGVRGLESTMELDPSDPARVLSVTSPSGASVTRAYEPFDPAAGRYSRALDGTLSPGRTLTTSYYAAREIASAPGCPEAPPAVQGGLGRDVTLPGGRRVRQVYDDAGRVTARYAGATLVACMSYDAAGAPSRVRYPGDGTTGEAVSERIANADGNPFVVRTRSVEGDRVAETEVVVDLLGREVASRDPSGALTRTAYDALDRTTTITTTTRMGETVATGTRYGEDALPEATIADGVTLATYRRDVAGRLVGAAYSNGARLEVSYDRNGSIAEQAFVVDGVRVSDRVTRAATGRIVERRLAGPGADARWEYAYDLDGRLTGATLSGATPAGIATGAWGYRLDSAGRRTRVTTPAGEVVHTYDDSGRIVATSDPAFAAGFAYDARGRATQAGPLSIAYGAAGNPDRIGDGRTTIETIRAAGTVLGGRVRSGPDAPWVERRYAAGGLALDADGHIVTRTVPLLGGASVELPPPGAGGESRWRYLDAHGSTAWTATGGARPSTTTLYDPDGNRLNPGRPDPSGDDPARPDLGWQAGAGLATSPLSVPTVGMGPRTYVPRLGVFLQPDPRPGAAQTDYGYAGSDPVNASDPGGAEGEWWAEPLAAVAAVVVAVALTKLTAGTGATVAAKAFAATGKLTWSKAASGAFLGAVTGAGSDAAAQGVLIAGGAQEEYDWRGTVNAGLAGGAAGAVGGWLEARDELATLARGAGMGGQVGDDLANVGLRRGSVDSFRSLGVRDNSLMRASRRGSELGGSFRADELGGIQQEASRQRVFDDFLEEIGDNPLFQSSDMALEKRWMTDHLMGRR